jgi:hypothetical protein
MPLSASALRAVFARSGKPSAQTYFFADAPSDVAATIVSSLGEPLESSPVLVSWRSDIDWVVITPRELIVNKDKRVSRVPVTDIVEVEPLKRDAVTHRPLPKTEMNQLHVVLRTGESIDVQIDQGGAFIGFWNVLTSLQAANRARETR